MQFPNMFFVDVDKGPATQSLHPLFLGDALANRIGVYLYKNGEPFSPGGSAFGRAVLSGGETVLIQNGVVSENQIYIDLPSGVYAEQGPVKISVSWTDGTTTTTVLEGTGNVRLTETGTIIDPGTIISDVTALIQAIETAVDSIPPTYTDLLETIAPEFSTEDNYTAGQYVWYSGSLYRFKADHSAGAWSGTDAALVTVGGDLQGADERYLQQMALPGKVSWAQGTLSSSNGYESNSNSRIRTRIFPAVAGFVGASGYKYAVYVFNADGTYLGVYQGNGTLAKSGSWQTGRLVLRGLNKGLFFRLVAANSGDTAIGPESGSNIQMLVDTDTTMALHGIPAEGHAAGELLYPAAKNVGRINLFDKNDPDIVTGKYINTYSNGAFIWYDSESYGETGYIPVEPGDIVVAFYAGNTSPTKNIKIAACTPAKAPAATYSGALDALGGVYVNNGFGYLRFPFQLALADDFMLIKVRPDDPLPFDCAGEPYTPFGGYTLPGVVGEMAKESEIEELRAEIAGQALGAQWQGKTWYAYGTSITDTTPTGKYPPYLAQMAGMTLVDKGVGGGGIGNLGAYSHGQVYSAICNTTDGKLNADLITLETGANDVNADVPLGTIYDTGTETLAGCLNDCLRYLQANTDAQIAVTCSPATTTAPNAANKYYEWAEMVERICRINRVHFLNPDNNMGYAKLASDRGSDYVVDNIHQTNLGGYIMAQNLWYQLRNIPLFYTAIPES